MGLGIQRKRWQQIQFSSVQSLSRVRLLATPWITARQAYNKLKIQLKDWLEDEVKETSYKMEQKEKEMKSRVISKRTSLATQ